MGIPVTSPGTGSYPVVPQAYPADSGTPMPFSPMPPSAPGGYAAQERHDQRGRRFRNGHGQAPGTLSGEILVRPFVGYGVRAEFDPASGALRAAAPDAGGVGGVYGDVGGVQVVFYRDGARLALRVSDRMIDLDGPVSIEHGPADRRHTRFAVVHAGTVICELFYRSLPREMDLGAHIAQVLANPAHRAEIFAPR